MIGNVRKTLLSFGIASFLLTGTAVAQTPAAADKTAADKKDAYFNFAMGHMYGELANAYGNRGEYVNKAIDAYKAALKLDPTATFVTEELSELYVQVGQLQKGIAEAETLVKQDPNNVNAHRILARIYSRMIGGDQPNGKVNQEMLKNALAEYKKIAELDPKDPESFSMLARLYRASHDEAAAEAAYRKLLEIDSTSEEALTGLAAVYSDKGDLKNAIGMLKRAVEKDPNPRTLGALAEFYEQTRDFVHAADALKQAIGLTAENENLRRAYARDLFEAGRLDESIAVYKELATENPKEAEFQVRLTDLYTRKKDFTAARVALAAAKKLNNSIEIRSEEADILDAEEKAPQAITFLTGLLAETKKDTYPDAEKQTRIALLERLAQLQRKGNKNTDAVASYRQIAEMDSALTPKVEFMVIDTYVRARDYKQAKPLSDVATKKFPTDRTLALQHVELLSEMGQVDAAVKEISALPNAGKDREIQLAIAQFYERAKRFDDEKRVLDQLETAAATEEEKMPMVFMRGAMYERMKNFDAAEGEFRKVLGKDENNAQALNYLGYMLADRGVRLDEAQKMISKALDTDPENGAYLDSLGWVYYKQNQLDKAVEKLQLALDRAGSDPAIHDHLGDVYFKQGKVKDAIQQWESSLVEYKKARLSEQDPAEIAKVAKKLEAAKVKTADKGTSH